LNSFFKSLFLIAFLTTAFRPAIAQETIADLLETPFFQYMREAFPEEYQEIIFAFKQNGDDPEFESGYKLGMQSARGLITKYASNITKASDDSYRKLILGRVEFLTAIKNNQGEETCTAFLRGGSRALDLTIEDYSPLMSEQPLLVIKAIRDGMDREVPVAAPVRNDWQEIREKMLQRHVELVDKRAIEDPEFCSALISFYTLAGTIPGESAHRVRGQLAADMIGYRKK